ncbi:MAG: hypothetical protein JW709_10465 [Sedimentisphaerales bacterium]|nr:hypothetical protein [Sedimentisphaerales bacterium]
MGKNKSEKQKKTLHLPQWICELLDMEGSRLGGRPGYVAAAAILMFNDADPDRKAHYLRRLHEQELTDAYNLTDNTRNREELNKVVRRIVVNASRNSQDETGG